MAMIHEFAIAVSDISVLDYGESKSEERRVLRKSPNEERPRKILF